MDETPPIPTLATARQRADRGYGWKLFARASFALCFALAIFIAGIAISTIALYRGVRSEEIEAIERARAVGLPLTGKELETLYPRVPDERNAAVAFRKIFERMPDKSTYLGTTPAEEEAWKERVDTDRLLELSPDSPLPDDMRTAFALYVDLHAHVIPDIHAALQYPECQFLFELREGPNTDLSHLAQLRAAARIFQYRSILAADANNVDLAIVDIDTVQAIADALEGEKYVIGGFIGIALRGIGLDAAEKLLYRRSMTDSQLQRLSASCEMSLSQETVKRWYEGELLNSVGIYDADYSSLTPQEIRREIYATPSIYWDGHPESIEFSRRLFEWYIAHNRLIIIGEMAKIVEASQLPTWEILHQLGEISEALDDRRIPPILAGVIIPAVTRAPYAYVRCMTQRTNLTTAIAVERYRVAHGNLPETLDALVPDYLDSIPIDAFDGNPLRYRVNDIGYTIYSIGPDQIDDSGVPMAKVMPDEPGDIVLTIRR